ncbi:MAG TPA: metallopeptidase TldD-related protein [Terriglobales bacterium]|nr:metallopeptidase TldD-related protein [Terriglobales bacterium]
MRSLLRRLAIFLVFLTTCLFVAVSAWAAGPPPAPAPNLLLDTMQQELTRAMRELGKANPPPYFMSYSVSEHQYASISATQGALYNSAAARIRSLDVSVRVGSPALDNTHSENRASGLTAALLPVEDDRDAIARVLWLTTDRQYKQAARTFDQVKTSSEVRTDEEDKSPDFSQEQPQAHVAPPVPIAGFGRAAWEAKARRYSALFVKYPEVYRSVVTVIVDSATHYFVSSEGSRIESQRPQVRLILYAETRAEDGMDLLRNETFDGSSFDRLPSDAVVEAKIQKMAEDLKNLRTAPLVEPFSGPSLLSGRAAAVFFHEVLGHRLEGQRQRGDQEGQTFTKKVNQEVLPTFLSVVDDPTLKELGGIELSGWYDFDDEGVPAQRTEVVQNGILRQFLMSRMPIKGFSKSNGHGRAQDNYVPVGRQGNLIVTSTKTVPDAQMHEMLIAEVKKQNKPYGLYFEDIAGGFTLTTRQLPQAFQVLPLMVWRVYPDGRPDELVRGVDIVGTPLASLNRLVLTGDVTQVFNGQCGAESGYVAVSAASPAILFSELEVQKKAKSNTRPPILPPPAFEKIPPPGILPAPPDPAQKPGVKP